MRRAMVLIGAAIWLAGCREQKTSETTGFRTGSGYTSGSDSGSVAERIPGTSTGAQLEAPHRIAGVVTVLERIDSSASPTRTNLTALRGELNVLTTGMRDDFRRVGLADTGQFHALSDSIDHELGGGAGGLADQLTSRQVSQLSHQVHRLIDSYDKAMGRTEF